LIIDLYEQPRLSGEGIDCLFTLAHAAFNQKRKMLRNSLKPVLGDNFDTISTDMASTGIDLRRRPENLTLPEWIQLAEVYLAHSKKT
jgi:16S rRNA A1518/A1519 N6-dimethyltransferase RsmA/KsgA/DIM1 with predicted DNA glycosylase/AP lyase activity